MRKSRVRASGVLVGLMLLGTLSVVAQSKVAFPTTMSDGLLGPVEVVFAQDSSMATVNRLYYGAYGIDSTIMLGHKLVYHYNEQGHLVAREWLPNGGKEVYQIRATDKYGNWTPRKATLLDGTELYEDRIILYYNAH